MKAVMLAAGVGKRLYGDDGSQPPKSLMRFDGKSLMGRHIEVLKNLGVDGLALVVGFRKADVAGEALAVGGPGFVRTFDNPRYREGSVISMWTAREVFKGGDDILFMDADVLYHPDLIARLVNTPHPNCLLLDRDFEAGDEPVKLCFKDGRPVEFRKKAEGAFDVVGEWPGFLRLSPDIAAKVVDAAAGYLDRGDFEAPYEEAIRQVLLSEPAGTFAFEDVTGVPWIEIDFPADVERARTEILPLMAGSLRN